MKILKKFSTTYRFVLILIFSALLLSETAYGRFLQPDPAHGLGGDPNLYAALNNNPISYVDPMGTDAKRLRLPPTPEEFSKGLDNVRRDWERQREARFAAAAAVSPADRALSAAIAASSKTVCENYMKSLAVGPQPSILADLLGGGFDVGIEIAALFPVGRGFKIATAVRAGLITKVVTKTVTSKPVTVSRALEAGHKWLRPGYKEIGKPGSGVFKSADGLRGFRMTENDITGKASKIGPHVHFEFFDKTGQKTLNVHTPLR